MVTESESIPVTVNPNTQKQVMVQSTRPLSTATSVTPDVVSMVVTTQAPPNQVAPPNPGGNPPFKTLPSMPSATVSPAVHTASTAAQHVVPRPVLLQPMIQSVFPANNPGFAHRDGLPNPRQPLIGPPIVQNPTMLPSVPPQSQVCIS